MTTEFTQYVRSELSELETRDVDQLFDCLMDNLAELGDKLSDVRQCSLYQTIEHEVRKQK